LRHGVHKGDEDDDDDYDDDAGTALGGLLRGKGARDLPMCKHLLACVLVERIEALQTYVEERRVSWEEIAGWAAGWGG
jgi:hypothetical protein